LALSYAEHFYLVDAGQGRWVIRHQITNELAGRITRSSQGFVLSDDQSHLIGTFGSVDDALRGLYSLV
jgi:hypothetical protein